MMGIGNGQPSYSSSYDDSILQSYAGLMSQINQHNTYQTWTDAPVIQAELMSATGIIRGFYAHRDQPDSLKYGEADERYCADWLLEAVNRPKKLGWPTPPPLPVRALVKDRFRVDFNMMHAIDMNLRVMSASAVALNSLGKSTVAFRDEDNVVYRMFMLASKLLFQDALIPFTYYNNYLTQEGARVDVYIAPKDCAPEIDGWQLHIHPTTDTIKVGNTNPIIL